LNKQKLFVGGYQNIDVNAYIYQYVRDFIRELESAEIEYKKYPKIFMIGGAIEYKPLFDALSEEFKAYDIEPLPLPQFANVLSLYNLMQY
jgi:hypothetical protein